MTDSTVPATDKGNLVSAVQRSNPVISPNVTSMETMSGLLSYLKKEVEGLQPLSFILEKAKELSSTEGASWFMKGSTKPDSDSIVAALRELIKPKYEDESDNPLDTVMIKQRFEATELSIRRIVASQIQIFGDDLAAIMEAIEDSSK